MTARVGKEEYQRIKIKKMRILREMQRHLSFFTGGVLDEYIERIECK